MTQAMDGTKVTSCPVTLQVRVIDDESLRISGFSKAKRLTGKQRQSVETSTTLLILTAQ
jgi:hypothetical protein